MAKYVIQEETLNNIGDAIREKTGRNYKIPPAQMPTEIKSILSNNISPITIRTNGTYNPPVGVDGYAPVVVDLPIENGIPVDKNVFANFYENEWRDENYDWHHETRNWADTGSYHGNKIRDWVFDNFYHEIREYMDPIGNAYSFSNACERFCYNNTHMEFLDLEIACSNFESMFEGCTNLKGFNFDGSGGSSSVISNCRNMLKNCHNFRLFDDYETYPDVPGPYIPEEGGLVILGTIDFSNFVNLRIDGAFNGCYSLRRIPNFGYRKKAYNTNNIHGTLVETFRHCHALDNIQDFPLPVETYVNYTDFIFYNTFVECFRLNKLTFLTDEKNQPFVADWSGQTIDLSKYVGYAYRKEYDGKDALFGFNAYLVPGYEIKDEESYLRNKDEIRSFTYNVGYSRYNKTSAIETINTLPDTSAAVAGTGRTNTIKFTGIAGELTNGGAIQTLSDTDIAVAAAKGWTVAYV